MSHVITAVTPMMRRSERGLPRTPRSRTDAHRRGASRQRRRQRVIAAALSTIVAAAGVAWAVAGGASNPRPRPISGQPVSLTAFPICLASHLHVSLSGQPQGAAGTDYFTLKLLNNGPECTVAPVTARGFNTSTSGYEVVSNVFITSQTKTVVASGRAAYGAAGHWGYRELAGFDVSSGQRERHRVALAGNHSLIGAVALRTAVCTVTKSMHTQSASLNPSGL